MCTILMDPLSLFIPCRRKYRRSEYRTCCCIFNGITSVQRNSPFFTKHNYVFLTVLAIVFSMSCYKIGNTICSLVIFQGISHLSVVVCQYTHSPKHLCVYQENTNDFWNIQWFNTRKRY